MDQTVELPLNFKSLPLHPHQISQKLFPSTQAFISLSPEKLQHIQPLKDVNVIWWYTSRDSGQYLRAAKIIYSSTGESK